MSSSLLSLGRNSLLNYQAAISVTGNNVANQNVEGYHRQSVTFSSTAPVTTSFGQLGTGAEITAVSRSFDVYLEQQYNAQKSDTLAWQTAYDQLALTESRFIQDEDYGMSAILDDFWSAWQDLSENPDDEAARSVLLTTSETLASLIGDAYDGLAAQQRTIEGMIGQEVGEVNRLMDELAALNTRIAADSGNNQLLDSRDQLIKELSGKLDTSVLYQDNGQVTVMTTSGQTLVSGGEAYALAYEGPQAFSSLTPGSNFDGQPYFSGSSDREITLKAATDGNATGGAGAATFNVSLDGGRTWLTGEDGQPLAFTPDDEGLIEVDGVEIRFGQAGDSATPPANDVTAGDVFTIVPKNSLYWYETSSSKVNVSPLYADNGENKWGRISGGTLAGLSMTADRYLGEYKDQLDAFAEALIWEVNFAHSQGAGLSPLSSASSAEGAEDASRPMSQSGLPFADRLAPGSLSFALYDSATGKTLGVSAVDFSGVAPGQETFDPDVHSLEDVAQAITDSFPGQLSATVEDGHLVLEADPSVKFEFAGDSSGILAATGLNTFFSGADAESIAVNVAVAADPERICAGHVNGAGEVNAGDNETANALAALADKEVAVSTLTGTSTQTLSEYMGGLISGIGADTAQAEFNYEYSEALSYDLFVRQEQVSGVNLDEELTLLTQYQQGYETASRLIQTATEMFDTILSLKS